MQMKGVGKETAKHQLRFCVNIRQQQTKTKMKKIDAFDRQKSYELRKKPLLFHSLSFFPVYGISFQCPLYCLNFQVLYLTRERKSSESKT